MPEITSWQFSKEQSQLGQCLGHGSLQEALPCPAINCFFSWRQGRVEAEAGSIPASPTSAIAISSWGGGQSFGICKLYCTFHSLPHTRVTSVSKQRYYRSCYIPQLLIISPLRMVYTVKTNNSHPNQLDWTPKQWQSLDEATKTFHGLHSHTWQRHYQGLQASINHVCTNL